MAAPQEVTIRNLSGKWTMNKTLSDNQDKFLSLQKIGWVTRKAVSFATVTLEIKQYEQDGVTQIDIAVTASGLSSTHEARACTWTERGHQDRLFGKVKGKTRFIKKNEFEPAVDNVTADEKKYLLAERLKDGSPSAFLDDEYIQTVAFSQDGLGWGVDMLWGFENVNGARHYTRRLICKNDGKTELMRLVYDYNGPL